MNYFLPRTTHNVSQYYLELESKHLPPVVAEQRRNILKTWHNSMGAAKDGLEKAREGTGELVQKGLQNVEQGTGLKVGSGANVATTDAKKTV
jgi:organizing structure protein 2